MEIRGKHVVITGAAGGIGRALVARMAAEGARGIVVADMDEAGAVDVARGVSGLGLGVDVGRESEITRLVAAANARFGPVDIFFSNAGLGELGSGIDAPDEVWDRLWRVHAMSHVWAARAVVPDMVQRGEGYLVNTASAAGLLAHVAAMVYTVTKHAAVSIAEWLAINYRDAGVRVSCLCPQGVATRMLDAEKDPAGYEIMRQAGILQPEDVAEAVVEGIRAERFLILPHADVAEMMRRKAGDPDRWLSGMRRLRQKHAAGSQS
jgi:NAD(P)-dependent dehydrogenase (short-subunit alcohol dehydrogenase family)